MKDFEKLITKSIDVVTSLGITPGKITEWKLNTRSKKRWGMCRKLPNGSFSIQIAKRLIEDNAISERACMETIIHEILHTCPGCMNHTGKWKEYASLINKRYGYNIKRTTSGEEKGVENYKASFRLDYHYRFRCKRCGYTILKKKRCKFTHYYKNFSCPNCGTRNAFIKTKL